MRVREIERGMGGKEREREREREGGRKREIEMSWRFVFIEKFKVIHTYITFVI